MGSDWTWELRIPTTECGQFWTNGGTDIFVYWNDGTLGWVLDAVFCHRHPVAEAEVFRELHARLTDLWLDAAQRLDADPGRVLDEWSCEQVWDLGIHHAAHPAGGWPAELGWWTYLGPAHHLPAAPLTYPAANPCTHRHGSDACPATAAAPITFVAPPSGGKVARWIMGERSPPSGAWLAALASPLSVTRRYDRTPDTHISSNCGCRPRLGLSGGNRPARSRGRLTGMAELGDPKTALHHYLKVIREDLICKLDGLSERDARLPRTATGNNLLGLVKHCLNVEADYFGPTFGREFPTPEELVPTTAYEEDPQADWYARDDETKDGLIDLYRRVGAFVDQTIEQLPLDAPGRVGWWRPGRQDVTLQRIIVHVICDLARHAGHADIMREQHDGAIGLRPENTNVPDGYDWPAYVAKLTRLADRLGAG